MSCPSFFHKHSKKGHFCFLRDWWTSEIHFCCIWAKEGSFLLFQRFKSILPPPGICLSRPKYAPKWLDTGSSPFTQQPVLSVLQRWKIVMIIFSKSFCFDSRSYNTFWGTLCLERFLALWRASLLYDIMCLLQPFHTFIYLFLKQIWLDVYSSVLSWNSISVI